MADSYTYSHRPSSVSRVPFLSTSPSYDSRPSSSWSVQPYPHPHPRTRLPSFSSYNSYLTSDEDELPLTSDLETSDGEADVDPVYTGIYKASGLYKAHYRHPETQEEIELSLAESDNDSRTSFFPMSSERGQWKHEEPIAEALPCVGRRAFERSERESSSAASSVYPFSSPSHHASSSSPPRRDSSPLPSSSPPTSPMCGQSDFKDSSPAFPLHQYNAADSLPSNAFITLMPSPSAKECSSPRISHLSASRPEFFSTSDELPTFTPQTVPSSGRLTIDHLLQSTTRSDHLHDVESAPFALVPSSELVEAPALQTEVKLLVVPTPGESSEPVVVTALERTDVGPQQLLPAVVENKVPDPSEAISNLVQMEMLSAPASSATCDNSLPAESFIIEVDLFALELEATLEEEATEELVVVPPGEIVAVSPATPTETTIDSVIVATIPVESCSPADLSLAATEDDCTSVDMDMQSDDGEAMVVDTVVVSEPSVLHSFLLDIITPVPVALPTALSTLQSIQNILPSCSPSLTEDCAVDMDLGSELSSAMSSPLSSRASTPEPEPVVRKKGKEDNQTMLKVDAKCARKARSVSGSPRKAVKKAGVAKLEHAPSIPKRRNEAPSSSQSATEVTRPRTSVSKRKSDVSASEAPPRKKKRAIETEVTTTTSTIVKKSSTSVSISKAKVQDVVTKKPQSKVAKSAPSTSAPLVKIKKSQTVRSPSGVKPAPSAALSTEPSSKLKPKPKRLKAKSLSLAFQEDLRGTLIEAMATSRASSLPASTLYKLVKESRPALMQADSASSAALSDDDDARKHEWTPKEWTRVIEHTLHAGQDECGLFDKIDSSFNDEAERALEAQWFYVPEKDCDQERASLIRSMMPRPAKRSVTKQYKQYYYKPLGKISRWDPEDDL